MDQYSRFRTLALTFKSTLPPLDMWLRTQSIDFIRTAYVGITLLEAALINFHAIAVRQGDEKAHQLSLISAHEIFTNSINLASASWNFGFLNPIIAVSLCSRDIFTSFVLMLTHVVWPCSLPGERLSMSFSRNLTADHHPLLRRRVNPVQKTLFTDNCEKALRPLQTTLSAAVISVRPSTLPPIHCC